MNLSKIVKIDGYYYIKKQIRFLFLKWWVFVTVDNGFCFYIPIFETKKEAERYIKRL